MMNTTPWKNRANNRQSPFGNQVFVLFPEVIEL
jgi:hypothetical protein